MTDTIEGSRGRTEWFTQARFGLFVHYGLYSTAARHEWVQNYERRDAEEYARYAEVFEPDRFDAVALARTAASAGAGYLVLTAKHHEGFCLWDTATTGFNSVATVSRDLVRETVDALRDEGLRVGLYLSLLDWHDPDYPIDRHHPLRGAPDIAERNRYRDMTVYRSRLFAQVEELLTHYGTIDYLFFDFTEPAESDGLPGKGPDDWHSDELLALCRRLQPGILVNDRLGISADLVTPEQHQPQRRPTRQGLPVLWEACQTINGSWGYDRENRDYKSAATLAEALVRTVSLSGNMLLNVGPTARGSVPGPDQGILSEIGQWMTLHERAVRGAGAADLPAPSFCLYTRRSDRLYLHLLAWPLGRVDLPDLAGRVSFARFLHDGSEVRMEEVPEDQVQFNLVPEAPDPGTLTLLLPARRPDVLIPVVELLLASNS